MIAKKKEIILKNGMNCILRSAVPEDAGEVLEVYKKIVSETDFSLSYPDEVLFTEENERDFLEMYANNEKNLFLLAEINEIIVGNVCFSSIGIQRKISHRCSLSIAILKEHWKVGLGTALLNAAIDIARDCGYKQMELSVASKNVRAVSLYEKIGFQYCGKIPNSFKYDDGSYDDEIFMAKEL